MSGGTMGPTHEASEDARDLGVRMLHAIPALPVKDLERSVEFYRDKLGLTLGHREYGFAIFRGDAVQIHLWVAADERWRTRGGSSPVVSGAESFIAGTASCQVQVEDVDGLYRSLHPLGIVHPNGQLSDEPWGTRDFGVTDLDNNLITFFERK